MKPKITNKEQKIRLQLQEGLNQFGLNPMDWTIQIQKNDFAQLINKKDQSFQFRGELNKNGSWSKMQLFSL